MRVWYKNFVGRLARQFLDGVRVGIQDLIYLFYLFEVQQMSRVAQRTTAENPHITWGESNNHRAHTICKNNYF